MLEYLRSMRLQAKLILLIFFILALALVVAHTLISNNIKEQVHTELKEKAEGLSKLVATSPTIIRSLQNESQHGEIQAYAQNLKTIMDVEFIVVFDMDGNRLSHPDVNRIGQHLVGGDELKVFEGQVYTSYAKGTLGASLRAFRPIYNEDNKQIGGVVVGILLADIDLAVQKNNYSLLYALGITFLVGVIAAILLARSVKNTLFGLEPMAIAQVTEERNAVLQSVREGIFVINKQGTLTIVNQEAKRILILAGITEDLVGKSVEKFVPHTRLIDVLNTGIGEFDQEQDLNGVLILTNRVPLKVNGEVVGALATFRDLTEVRTLAEELTGVNRYVEALRSQAHEFLNKLHVIDGLIGSQKYDALSMYLNKIVQDNQKELDFVTQLIEDPILAAFMQSKLSRSRELNVKLRLNPNTKVPVLFDEEFTHNTITIVGNLVDNAMDAVQYSAKKEVEVFMKVENDKWFFEVSDSGQGIDAEMLQMIFTRGYSTKGAQRGFGLFLVAKVLEQYNGQIEVINNPRQGITFKGNLVMPKGESCHDKSFNSRR